MLLPRVKGKTFAKIQTNPVVIPPIQNLLTFSELKTFRPSNETSTDNFTADIQAILNNVSDPVDIISITELQRKLELIRAQRKQSFTSLPFIIVSPFIFFLTTSVVALVCGIRHKTKIRKLCIDTPATTTSRPDQQTEVIYEEIQTTPRVRFVRGPVTPAPGSP